MSQKNPYWMFFNFNPWGKHIGDCAIRAVSAATGLDYREVCYRLGVGYKAGLGLTRKTGIGLRAVEKRFKEYFDIIEDFYENYAFVPDEMKGSKEDKEIADWDKELNLNAVSGITLNDFIQMFKNQGEFLVSLQANPNAKREDLRKDAGHIVYVRLNPKYKKQGFVDVFDSGELLVDTYMKVKHREPYDSPYSLKIDTNTMKFILDPIVRKDGTVLKESVNELETLDEMNEKAKKLCELMKKGIVEFFFIKKSTGEKRKAHGTLKRDLIPKEAQRKRGRPKKRPEDLVIYYDVDRKAIRSFRDYLLKNVNKNKKFNDSTKKEKNKDDLTNQKKDKDKK